ncbi:hypothetical protein HUJ05_007710, partial [Dendroctonus ponderosae]
LYTLRPWLLTPLDSPPINAAEERFDSRIKAVRSGIERCNGALKNRFRPDRAGKIINACVVLHNMCVKASMPEPEENPIERADLLELSNMERSNDPRLVNPDLDAARRLQREIAATHFN